MNARQITRMVLAYLNLSGSTRYDITFVDGFSKPKITAETEPAYYTTRSGKPVLYPNAYARYGRAVYHNAVRGTITVGKGWVIRRQMAIWAAKDRRNALRTLRLRRATPNYAAYDYALESGRYDLAVLFA